MNEVEASLIGLIERNGPLRYADVVNTALYGLDGFYSSGRGAGHRRDFVTSPEVGALFGAVLASALDSWWEALGRPDPFLVADCGAGPGTLAVTLLAAKPVCLLALRLVLVETSPAFREEHTRRRLPMVAPQELLGSVLIETDVSRSGLGSIDVEDPGEGWRSRAATPAGGPLCTSVPVLPECEFHVVVANELLDNLAFNVLQRVADEWSEVRVGHGPQGFGEVLITASPGDALVADRVVPRASEGVRIPLLADAHAWLRDVLARLVPGGRLVCFDYGATTAELATRSGGWLRTYRDQDRGHEPLVGLGDFDITIDVPFDQFSPLPTQLRTQSDFLRSHGLEALVAVAEERWRVGASVGDLAALKARSIPTEAKVLTDPAGLGAFLVAEWVR